MPGAGAMLFMFGGLGGKKKTVPAGLRVVSPTVASGYQGSKNGEMLTEAFVLAFNQLAAQRELPTTAPAGATESAAPGAVVAG